MSILRPRIRYEELASPDRRVTVAVPTIPPRRATLLPRALSSVLTQTLPAAALSVATDLDHAGAWVTRQRALDAVRTPWVAFLDDDDELKPEHLQRLFEHAEETGADYVFSWFDTPGWSDPLGHLGREFDPAEPHHTTMTVLVRTDLAREVGFTGPLPEHEVSGEDWRFILGCVERGAKIVHLPERTWSWHWHPQESPNTSGQPDRW